MYIICVYIYIYIYIYIVCDIAAYERRVRDRKLALDWGARRPRRCSLRKVTLGMLRFYPETKIGSRILRAIFRPLTGARRRGAAGASAGGREARGEDRDAGFAWLATRSRTASYECIAPLRETDSLENKYRLTGAVSSFGFEHRYS